MAGNTPDCLLSAIEKKNPPVYLFFPIFPIATSKLPLHMNVGL